MRRWGGTVAAGVLVASLLPLGIPSVGPSAPAGEAASPRPGAGEPTEYVVVYEADGDQAAGAAALVALGGRLQRDLPALGTVLVSSDAPGFAVAASLVAGVAGVARNRAIGRAVHVESVAVESVAVESVAADSGTAESGTAGRGRSAATAAVTATEPLVEGTLWHDAMMGSVEAHTVEPGRPGVLVGIVDTGVDASHPELAASLDAGLSRNFTRDDPRVDGACATDPDGSCDDPAGSDENGHGTHVAGIIAAAADGRGTVGVAPGSRIVSLRAGQDSGYFFLQPVLEAVAYAAEIGIDVLNLSFFVDPWLFNCPDNPRDTPAEQAEQRAIVAAVANALAHAHARDVTIVGALGNEHTDLAHAATDVLSPVHPPGSGRMRWVDDSCLSVPAELDHVIGVVGVGPSGKKADYSNHGEGIADLAAPGGYLRDFVGSSRYLARENMVLAPYPEAAARAQGLLGESGEPRGAEVVRDCAGGACRYYAYLQGTSMAAPQVAGVAALVVSRSGTPDGERGGLRMSPDAVEAALRASARDVPCPAPVISYSPESRPSAYDATCLGGPSLNSVYGDGVVDAATAVGAPAPLG